jgi:hypothetical protein
LHLERPIDSLGIEPRIDAGLGQAAMVQVILNRRRLVTKTLENFRNLVTIAQ